MLGEVASRVEYASDHLLQVRNGVLLAQRFSTRSRKFAGDPFLVAQNVEAASAARRDFPPLPRERWSFGPEPRAAPSASCGSIEAARRSEPSAARPSTRTRRCRPTAPRPPSRSEPRGAPTRSGRSISRGIWPRGSRSRPETRRTRPGRPTERASPMASLAAGSWTSIKIGRRDRGRDPPLPLGRAGHSVQLLPGRSLARPVQAIVHGADLGLLRPVAPGFGPFGPGHGHAVP